MTDIERALAMAAKILYDAKKYPWKTARYLSVRLRDEGCSIGAKTLEKALIEHSRSTDRVIRYSFFPARKTLDLLWGHIDNIQNFDNLPEPFLNPGSDFLEEVGDFKQCNLPENAPWYFLSHNFRDLPTVRIIREDLISRGYGVWIAEAEIFHGDMITQKVQEGLEKSHQFLLYMTPLSLGSRWVLKEAGVAINRWKLPPIILISAEDQALINLFQPWLEKEWDEAWLCREIDKILIDANEEPAATMLPDLIIGALRNVPHEQRQVVIYPTPREPKPGYSIYERLFYKRN
ncbi:MAG: TIR domain-containing protein [Desulfobacterales bacterium]|jgi:hypothetical protein